MEVSHHEEEPPSKRRRFFSDSDAPVLIPNTETATSVVTPPSHSLPIALAKPRLFDDQDSKRPTEHPIDAPRSPATRTPLSNRDIDGTLNQTPAPRHEATPSRTPSASTDVLPAASSSPIPFDEDAFESFVGDKVKPEVLSVIRDHCGNDIERAVNMYFDGTWKSLKKQNGGPRPGSVSHVSAGPSAQDTSTRRFSSPRTVPRPPAATRSMPPRYIGAFGAEGWATRSGTHLLKHGDVVHVQRQKLQPPRSMIKSKNKLGATIVTEQVSAAAGKKSDVIVRLTNAAGSEIARLAKDTASWVSTLIDQGVCKFEGTCVYAPERMRTNDTIFVQLRCYLLPSAFSGSGFRVADNRRTGIFEQDETPEERDLRLRQVALVRLFQEINLSPTKSSAASTKNQRQDILQAAEMAERPARDQQKQTPASDASSGASPPSDEAEEGQELEQDQLDALYRKAQSFDFNTPEAEPAESFAMTLRPYQKQSLHWMLAKEKDGRNVERQVSMHPLWEEYTWPTKDHDDRDLPPVPDQPAFYVNPYSGEMSLDFPVQEQRCLGGILADEMGLGKTIQMLSLIHTHRSDVALRARQARESAASLDQITRLPSSFPPVVDAPCTTLVVAPMSLLAQWQSEAEKASQSGSLKSMIYYGSEKSINLQNLCCEANAASAPDVIITSYGVVLSEFTQVAANNGNRGYRQGLFSLNFFRVILDEAHTIKNRQSKTARACYELSAEHRWVLTGTPIVNRLEDLFSLVRFLRVEPWNNFSFWRTFITVPFESKNFMRALDVVQTVLEPLVMRRTKDMKTPDGQPLVPLPPKDIEIVNVELSKTERDVYDYIFTRARRSFQANVEAGTVLKAFTNIFAQILRLRQSCCHPVLVRNRDIVAEEEEAGAIADAAAGLADDMDLQSLIERFTAATDDAADANTFGAHVLQQIRDEAANECPICAEEPMIEQTVTGCWHSACKKCLLDYIRHQTDRHEVPRCFQCRETIQSRDLFQVVRHDDDHEPSSDRFGSSTPRISLQRLGVNDSSAKIVSLIGRLRELRREHPTMKSVVFSQFTSFLTLIEQALERANIRFLRLDGTMAQKTRAAVLAEFQEARHFTVLLISLRAGGVGLNLTSAKRVYMMDPWWSFAVESQAIDRVHRMGQEDEVKVYRFIVKDSVEERMLKVQERKKFIASSLGMMSDEEKKLQRIEDIKELLS